MNRVIEIGKRAKRASQKLLASNQEQRNNALKDIAKNIMLREKDIIAANKIDLELASKNNLSAAMIDRLQLTVARIKACATTATKVAQQPEVVGNIFEQVTMPNGLVVKRQRIPLGVIAMILESRPNCVVDCSALAIKSANAIILKGGKEAHHSNEILGNIITSTISEFLPEGTIQVLPSSERSTTQELLKMDQYINVIIPRGGESLIKYVVSNASMPVIAHYKGLCHIYVHDDADVTAATNICFNAKAQRPGVCNAMETLLIHENIATPLLQQLIPRLQNAKVEIRGCQKSKNIFAGINLASPSDWAEEYLDLILSIRIVSGIDEAIEHIARYGSNHTEGICANDPAVISKFQNSVDASCITVNASTRFNDGEQLNLGAELGISTTKFHAYGPMGAAEMTTSRFIVEGDGHIR